MSNEEIKNVSTKLVVGLSDPTFSPSNLAFSGTHVSAWGVFGLPTGSTPAGGLVPRAVVQIGPPCPPLIPPPLSVPLPPLPNSLEVNGNTLITGNLFVLPYVLTGSRGDVYATGDVISNGGGHVLSAKKNFDIPHPSKKGWRLTHSCIEGPEAAVYVRGRVTNQTEIILPSYWNNLVDVNTITVNLTPIGAHQEVFVQKWNSEKICLHTNCGMPIDCFYHVYAERLDTEKLIPEYEGTIEDYPGDNLQRSIAGYHYDSKGRK